MWYTIIFKALLLSAGSEAKEAYGIDQGALSWSGSRNKKRNSCHAASWGNARAK
jgi:hypothetical protein